MAEYIPSPSDWVREQVELYESSGGTEGTTLRETGLPVIIVTNRGNRTGAIRKTPLMRVKDGDSYVLVGSQGGAPTNPQWVYNLRADANVEIRDETEVHAMRVREVGDDWGAGAAVGDRGGGVFAVRGVPGADVAADPGVPGGAGLATADGGMRR